MNLYVLSFRNRDKGGRVVPGRLTAYDAKGMAVAEGRDAESFLQQKRIVTFLVHGFANAVGEGREKLLHLANSLIGTGKVHAGSEECFVAVLWPGDAKFGGPLCYPAQGVDADATADQFSQFIDLVLGPYAGAPVQLNFVSHSMGARVVMETIKRLDEARKLGTGDFNVERVCLLAAAIDDFSLSCLDDYRQTMRAIEHTTVLTSKKDLVLSMAYPIGDLLQAWGYVKDRPGLALGRHGPQPCPDTGQWPLAYIHHEPIADEQKMGHSDYISTPEDMAGDTDRLSKVQTTARFVFEFLSGSASPRWG